MDESLVSKDVYCRDMGLVAKEQILEGSWQWRGYSGGFYLQKPSSRDQKPLGKGKTSCRSELKVYDFGYNFDVASLSD